MKELLDEIWQDIHELFDGLTELQEKFPSAMKEVVMLKLKLTEIRNAVVFAHRNLEEKGNDPNDQVKET